MIKRKSFLAIQVVLAAVSGGLILHPSVTGVKEQAVLNAPRQVPHKLSLQQDFAHMAGSYGLTFQDIQISVWNGERREPYTGELDSLTRISLGVVVPQAIASATFPGTVENWEVRISGKPGVGEYADGVAVTAGWNALQSLAELYDIGIIIGGNEGKTRDGSAAMELATVINPAGKNGIYVYFGDSLEVTNGVKNKGGGMMGSSSLMALVPLQVAEGITQQWQNDGYRITFVLPDVNQPEGKKVDVIVQGENTLKAVLSQLVGEEGVEKYVRAHRLITLDRPKHDELRAQASELGMAVTVIKDGDAVPAVLRAVFGIPGTDGKKAAVISTSGGCEAWMVAIAASLARGSGAPFFARTRIVSRIALKEVDNKAPKGTGALARALDWQPGDGEEMNEGNAVVRAMMERLDWEMGFLPVNREDLDWHAEVEQRLLAGITGQGVFAQAQVTGATEVDAGLAAPFLSPVTWYENEDGAGEVRVKGFLVSAEGKLLFYEARFTTQDIVGSRYAFLEHLADEGGFMASEVIERFQGARLSFWEAVESGKSSAEDLREYVHALGQVLLPQDVQEEQSVQEERMLLGKLGSLLESLPAKGVLSEQKTEQLQQEIRKLEIGVKRILLGEPFVVTANGEHHPLVQPAGRLPASDRLVADQI